MVCLRPRCPQAWHIVALSSLENTGRRDSNLFRALAGPHRVTFILRSRPSHDKVLWYYVFNHFLPEAATHVWWQSESFSYPWHISSAIWYPGLEWLLLIELQRMGGGWNKCICITLGTEQEFCRNWTMFAHPISLDTHFLQSCSGHTASWVPPGLWQWNVGSSPDSETVDGALSKPRTCRHYIRSTL